MISVSPQTKSILAIGALLIGSIVLWDQIENPSQLLDRFRWSLGNIKDTVIIAGVLYIVAGISHYILNHNIKNLKLRIYLTKVVSALIILIGIIAGIYIWVENQKNFTTYFGFITIAIAVSFQDLFRNIVGSIIINTTRNIEIGDSIEVQGHIGKVVDIGFLYTTLLETPSWETMEQINNREIKLPNQIFNNQVAKTYDIRDDYLWDEISLKLNAANIQTAPFEKKVLNIIQKEMRSHEQPGKSFLRRLNKNIIKKQSHEDQWHIRLYWNLEEHELTLTARYLVHNQEMRLVRSNLIKKLYPIIPKSND